jgi:hypothetical protein
MKNNFPVLMLTTILLLAFSGCAIVGGIFKAGMGFGILMVVVVIALILFLIGKMRKK